MVFLSGKRKETRIMQDIVKPYLSNQPLRKNWKNPSYQKIIELLETIPQNATGDLEYKIKTTLRILPEYEMYHQLYGIPKMYNISLLKKIKEYHSKNYPISKVKYNLSQLNLR